MNCIQEVVVKQFNPKIVKVGLPICVKYYPNTDAETIDIGIIKANNRYNLVYITLNGEYTLKAEDAGYGVSIDIIEFDK